MNTPDFSEYGLTLTAVPLHEGWFRGAVMDWEEAMGIAAQIRVSEAAAGLQVLVGLMGEDEGHRIYALPPVELAELVKEFQVGSRAEMTYGMDGEETMARVAEKLEEVERICPFIITFADAAGLHAEFTQPVTMEAAAEIEQVYGMEDPMGDGLENYLDDGLASALLKDQSMKLWWD